MRELPRKMVSNFQVDGGVKAALKVIAFELDLTIPRASEHLFATHPQVVEVLERPLVQKLLAERRRQLAEKFKD